MVLLIGANDGHPMFWLFAKWTERKITAPKFEKILTNHLKSFLKKGRVDSFHLKKQIETKVGNLMVGCVPLGNVRNKSPGCANPD